MLMTATETPTKDKKWTLMNVRPAQLRRFKAIASYHGLSIVDLFEQVLTALEADLAGKKPEA